MSSIRISMVGPGQAQAARKLGAASIPMPAWDAGGWSSRGRVNGSPGVRPIPAPAPAATPGRDRTAIAMTGNIGLPSALFDSWFPSVYFCYLENLPPVSVYSDNQMPVPARDPRGVTAQGPIGQSPGGPPGPRSANSYGIVMPGILNRGQRQVKQPRVTPSYPRWRAAR